MDEGRRRLLPLGEAGTLRVADDMPDVRGWEVVAADGAAVGRVTELLVDPAAGRVRYLEITTDGPEGSRRVHLPIGLARMDQARDAVLVPTVTTAAVAGLTTVTDRAITRDYEVAVRRSILGAADAPADARADAVDAQAADAAGRADDELDDDAAFYAHEAYDDRRFAAPRRAGDARGGDDDDGGDESFGYLAGVGGAMTQDDHRPSVVGEIDAGQISVPVMSEEAERREER